MASRATAHCAPVLSICRSGIAKADARRSRLLLHPLSTSLWSQPRPRLLLPILIPARKTVPGDHLRVQFSSSASAEPQQTTAAATPQTTSEEDDPDSPPKWTIKMLYDGACPLCMREVGMLRERNKIYGTIKLVDIAADSYSAEENAGLDFETAMGRIHAILRDGTVLTDVAAFRRLYEEVGLGWVYAITNYEPFATVADSVYSLWAKYRLPLTGRPPLVQVLQARQQRRDADANGCGREST